MPIKDLARSTVVTATPDTPVQDLARQMHDDTVGSIVITNDTSAIGIVTDRDLTTRVLTNDRDPTEKTAQDVMSEHLADEHKQCSSIIQAQRPPY